MVENALLNRFARLAIRLDILRRRAQGKSFSAIARELNREGIKGRYGCRWYAASVRTYLLKV